MIDREDAKAARGEPREIRTFGNVVAQHDRIGRIVAQNFFGHGALEGAAEARVIAFAEPDQVAAGGAPIRPGSTA